MWIWGDTNVQFTIAPLKFSLLDQNNECLWAKGYSDRNGSFSGILPKLGGKAPDVLDTELQLWVCIRVSKWVGDSSSGGTKCGPRCTCVRITWQWRWLKMQMTKLQSDLQKQHLGGGGVGPAG